MLISIPRKCLATVFTPLLLAVILFFPLKASAVNIESLKISYIYNIINFVSWPPQYLESAKGGINVCILGNNVFDKANELLQNRTIKNREIVLKKVKTPQELGGCHIVFFSETNDENVEQFINPIKKQPVLTISDNEEFAAKGGMIGFVVIDNNLKFEINLASAKTANLEISSRLLTLAIQIFK